MKIKFLPPKNNNYYFCILYYNFINYNMNNKVLHNNRLLNIKICRVNPKKLNYTNFKNTISKLPTSVDFRTNPKMPPIRDQGNIGSCTAFALSGCVEFLSKSFTCSQLFLYYNERKMENTINDDSGAYLHDGVTCLQLYGVCSSALWPYNTNNYKIKPTLKCFADALKHQALQVKNIAQDELSMKACLASGTPFVSGISVYSSFMSNPVALTGEVPMPNLQTDSFLGGHAICIIGYTDKYWFCRNSWGSTWGNKGYFRLPLAYLLDTSLTTDLWCLTKME